MLRTFAASQTSRSDHLAVVIDFNLHAFFLSITTFEISNTNPSTTLLCDALLQVQITWTVRHPAIQREQLLLLMKFNLQFVILSFNNVFISSLLTLLTSWACFVFHCYAHAQNPETKTAKKMVLSNRSKSSRKSQLIGRRSPSIQQPFVYCQYMISMLCQLIQYNSTY